MTVSTELRKTKLRGFLAKLEAGKNVQNRDLYTWLGAEWKGAIDGAWETELEQRKVLSSKPEAICQYENVFRQARLLENRADGYSRAGNAKQAHAFRARADRAYEALLVRYQEIVGADLSLHSWFDRQPSFAGGQGPSLCAETMPHVRTSRSLNNEGVAESMMERKLVVKAGVVRQALAEIEGELEPFAEGKTSERLERIADILDKKD